jgi:hypothetical protein
MKESSDKIEFIDDIITYIDLLSFSSLIRNGINPEVIYNYKSLQRFTKPENLNRISQKYNWLAHYHNTVVNEIDEAFFALNKVLKKDYLISPEELPTLFEFP